MKKYKWKKIVLSISSVTKKIKKLIHCVPNFQERVDKYISLLIKYEQLLKKNTTEFGIKLETLRKKYLIVK